MKFEFPPFHGLSAVVTLVLCVPCVGAQDPPRSGSAPAHASVRIETWHEPGLVGVKFKDGIHVRYRAGGLSDEGTGALGPALDVLAGPARGLWVRTHRLSEETLDDLRAKALALSHRTISDLNLDFRLQLEPDVDEGAAIDALRTLAIVEYAWPIAKPAPPPTVPDFTAFQTYLGAAPNGLNVRATWPRPAGAGHGVKICDVEYEYNDTHADLPFVYTVNPCPHTGFGSEHGTAVLGELFAKANGEGTIGMAYGAEAWFSPVSTAGGGLQQPYNVSAAITDALMHLDKGDVILIEQQLPGPNYPNYTCCQANPTNCTNNENCQLGLVPVEWDFSVRNSILTAVGLGIFVVEAAGNGSQNLDDAIYSDPLFAPPFPPFLPANDSGAILVGAGAAPGSSSGTPHLSKLWFSNYGSTVDLQGYGEDVETTGSFPGNLFTGNYGAPGSPDAYTHNFGGTSSASPMVAAACALLGSTFECQTHWPLDPKTMRDTLILTGTAQTGSGHIGPRPDLVKAQKELQLWQSGDDEHWLSTPPVIWFPSPRRDAAVAYFGSGACGLLFGGDSNGVDQNDTWVFQVDPVQPYVGWGQLPGPTPGPRSGAAMAYDAKRDRVVLYGGSSAGVPSNETWEFSGTTFFWSFVGYGPTARSGHVMAYDPVRERVVLVGGNCGAGCGGTWEWDGSTWQSFPGPVASGRIRSSMAWDSDRSRLVLFGGYDPLNFTDSAEVFERNGTSWTLVPSSGPQARSGAGLVYDTGRRRCVLEGGNTNLSQSPLSDTWEWNGSAWHLVNAAFPAHTRHAAIFEPSVGRLVTFGGETFGQVTTTDVFIRDRELELGAPYCFGDGLGGACPCGNSSGVFDGAGCMNSLGKGGKLRSRGWATLTPTFSTPAPTLIGSDMPNSAALYFQGTSRVNNGLGSVFGDGLRCSTGAVIRLGTKFNASGASIYPDPASGDLPILVKGQITMPGSLRTYQIWYRNPATFCTSSTFNLSNGLQVVWGL